MAKKSISSKKTTPEPETPAVVKVAKPRTRTSTPRKRANKNVVLSAGEATQTSVASSDPSDEEIRLRAYHRYLERGGQPGDEVADWVEARKDLLARRHP